MFILKSLSSLWWKIRHSCTNRHIFSFLMKIPGPEEKDIWNTFLLSSIKFCCLGAEGLNHLSFTASSSLTSHNIIIIVASDYCVLQDVFWQKEASVIQFRINRRLKHPFTHLSLLFTFTVFQHLHTISLRNFALFVIYMV